MNALGRLQEPDRTTLSFSPHGLGAPQDPDEALQYIEAILEQCRLVPDVPAKVRADHERLCDQYRLGILHYPLYSSVATGALLLWEPALRSRFMEWCGGQVVLRAGRQGEAEYPVAVYSDGGDAIKAAKRSKPSDARGPVELRVGDRWIEFSPMLTGLLRWARAAGFLRGQHARLQEQMIATMRNEVAHGGIGTVMPPDAARELRELTEMTNQLWGEPTPGGVLYPAPVNREVLAFCWNATRTRRSTMPADALRSPSPPDELADTVVLLRGAVGLPRWHSDSGVDPWWAEFDAACETTMFPADFLWGPGTRPDAVAWLTEHAPTGDTAEYIDRLFLVPVIDGEVRAPMRPEIAVGLPRPKQTGTWHIVRADFPNDAVLHVRDLTANTEHASKRHARNGECDVCPVEAISIGSWKQIICALKRLCGPIEPAQWSPFQSPESLHWPMSARRW